MNSGIKQNRPYWFKMRPILGLTSLLLSACVIQGVPQPAADVEAAAVEATMNAERAAVAESASRDDAGGTVAPASGNAEGKGEASMLITPTPDRSAEISQFVVVNTRRFRGNPDASVVLIEFSDFQ